MKWTGLNGRPILTIREQLGKLQATRQSDDGGGGRYKRLYNTTRTPAPPHTNAKRVAPLLPRARERRLIVEKLFPLIGDGHD